MDIKIDFGDTDIIDLSMVMKKGPLFQKTNTHGHEYSQPYHHEVFVFTHGSLMHTQRERGFIWFKILSQHWGLNP